MQEGLLLLGDPGVKGDFMETSIQTVRSFHSLGVAGGREGFECLGLHSLQ